MYKYADSTIFTGNPTVLSPKVVRINIYIYTYIYIVQLIITKVVFSKTKNMRTISRPEH